MNLVNKTFSLSLFLSGYPKMEVCQEYYGLPPPPVGFGQPLHLSKGDIIELSRADADLPWWEVTKPCIYILCILTNEWDSYCCVFELCFLWLMCRCDMLLSFFCFSAFFLSASRCVSSTFSLVPNLLFVCSLLCESFKPSWLGKYIKTNNWIPLGCFSFRVLILIIWVLLYILGLKEQNQCLVTRNTSQDLEQGLLFLLSQSKTN